MLRGTRALLQGNEGVHRLAGSECVLLAHLRPTVELYSVVNRQEDKLLSKMFLELVIS